MFLLGDMLLIILVGNQSNKRQTKIRLKEILTPKFLSISMSLLTSIISPLIKNVDIFVKNKNLMHLSHDSINLLNDNLKPIPQKYFLNLKILSSNSF